MTAGASVDAVVPVSSRPATPVAAALAVAVAAGAAALVGAVRDPGAVAVVGAAAVVVWAGVGAAVVVRAPGERAAGGALLVVAVAGAAAVAGGLAWIAPLSAVAAVAALALPAGRLDGPARQGAAALLLVASVPVALACRSDASRAGWLLWSFGAVCTVAAATGVAHRFAGADEQDRSRLLLVVSALVAAVTAAAVLGTLELLAGWPPTLVAWLVGLTAVVPAAVLAGTVASARSAAGDVVIRVLGVAGMAASACAVFLVVVVGLGRVPRASEQEVVGLTLAAAGLALLFALPVRRRVEGIGVARLAGDRRSSASTLRTFETRMSRAVPMDELQLQLVESLQRSFGLLRAELWTGTGGVLERVTSVPHQGAGRLTLGGDELPVVARAHVSGRTWLGVWIPDLLEGRGPGPLRVASVAHLGELLGLIVAERPADGAAFTEDDDAILADLARPLGLALHNVRLDSALQASLDELEARNEELQASRLRIVTAADESRRRIERDLHDGAQQHLVALAVKIGLVRQLMAPDPAAAQELLEELRGDVQATLEELRELAHGIYPPLLRDRGLAEALRAAANRSPVAASVDATELARRTPEVEAAIYFCCLEALQNAGKYAGESASVTIALADDGAALRFSVHDDGPGFEVSTVAAGHGFANMRDRLGAVGGELTVTSGPGRGTTVSGEVRG